MKSNVVAVTIIFGSGKVQTFVIIADCEEDAVGNVFTNFVAIPDGDTIKRWFCKWQDEDDLMALAVELVDEAKNEN